MKSLLYVARKSYSTFLGPFHMPVFKRLERVKKERLVFARALILLSVDGAECHLCRLDSRLSSLLRSFSEEVDVQCLADVLQSIKKDSKCIVLFDPVGKRGTLREGLLEKISSTMYTIH